MTANANVPMTCPFCGDFHMLGGRIRNVTCQCGHMLLLSNPTAADEKPAADQNDSATA
jgi:hypothetical protein